MTKELALKIQEARSMKEACDEHFDRIMDGEMDSLRAELSIMLELLQERVENVVKLHQKASHVHEL